MAAGREDRRGELIRELEDENEKLADYAIRVSSEIEELRRVINKRH